MEKIMPLPLKSNEVQILEGLAQVHQAFDLADWKYAPADSAGKFFVDRCIESATFLKRILLIIAKGLATDQTNAKSAALLFDKLYKVSFNDIDYKSVIQNNFKKILPSNVIEALDNNKDASLAFYLKSFSMPTLSKLCVNKISMYNQKAVNKIDITDLPAELKQRFNP